MIYESDISQLLSKWEDRLSNLKNSQYKDALYDCIYELKITIDDAHKAEEEEMLYQEAMDSILINDIMVDYDQYCNEFN